MRTLFAALVVAGTAVAVSGAGQRQTHGRLFPLFPPEDLGMLESPDRDEWQQPDRIMDALQIAEGSRVADVGAGGGWFTIRLAGRVGPNGVVYAEDIQTEMLDSITRRVNDQRLTNVRIILGTPDDPRLPAGLDAALIVGTYPYLRSPVSFLRNTAKALGPRGRLGIVDFRKDGAGGPGPPIEERLDAVVVERDAKEAGLTLLKEETFLRYQYLLIFGR
jgi:ubiquinone/menaquinone biosynthesis C-methylase UbiE